MIKRVRPRGHPLGLHEVLRQGWRTIVCDSAALHECQRCPVKVHTFHAESNISASYASFNIG